jgi:hypothetical protein
VTPDKKAKAPKGSGVSPPAKAKREEDKMAGITNAAISHRIDLP